MYLISLIQFTICICLCSVCLDHTNALTAHTTTTAASPYALMQNCIINVNDYTDRKRTNKQKNISKISRRDVFDHYSFKIIFSLNMKLTKWYSSIFLTLPPLPCHTLSAFCLLDHSFVPLSLPILSVQFSSFIATKMPKHITIAYCVCVSCGPALSTLFSVFVAAKTPRPYLKVIKPCEREVYVCPWLWGHISHPCLYAPGHSLPFPPLICVQIRLNIYETGWTSVSEAIVPQPLSQDLFCYYRFSGQKLDLEWVRCNGSCAHCHWLS